jgi:hypothetical protein
VSGDGAAVLCVAFLEANLRNATLSLATPLASIDRLTLLFFVASWKTHIAARACSCGRCRRPWGIQ